ncbi:hypothetical protein [Streptomyces sp. SID3343]|uniref:hypothetical protein n=1 Tax=Streptomyces sp. SID3343 TaxID=2690260 RepID=UPI001367AE59|nr:hypothetical protein [Streptomyces sp. SID3343]
MLLTGVALILISLLAGLFAVLAVADRAGAARSVDNGSGPLGVDTQEIYRALADADATAAAGLLEGGVESDTVRQVYQNAIDTAARNLIKAGSAGVSEKEKDELTKIGTQLPVYASLVERAKAETRQGNTVGAAYLRAASNNVMRKEILPAAEKLHTMAQQRLVDDHDDATSKPWVPIVLLLISLVAIAASLLFFAKRTRRRINVGLLIAGVGTLVSVVWLWTGTDSSRADLDRSKRDGWGPVEKLAQARFQSLRAHGDESLTLVMRGSDNGSYEEDFKDAWTLLMGGPEVKARPASEDGPAIKGRPAAIGALVEAEKMSRSDPETRAKILAAQTAAAEWLKAHESVTKLYDSGRFKEAVSLVTKADGASRVAFARVEAALDEAVAEDQQDFENSVTSGRKALNGLEIGVGVLALVAAAAIVDGVRREVGRYNRP